MLQSLSNPAKGLVLLTCIQGLRRVRWVWNSNLREFHSSSIWDFENSAKVTNIGAGIWEARGILNCVDFQQKKTSNKNQTSDVHPRWVWKSGNSAQVTNLGIWEACRGFSRLCRLPTKNTLKRNQTSCSRCPQFLLSPREMTWPPSLRCASPLERRFRSSAFQVGWQRGCFGSLVS